MSTIIKKIFDKVSIHLILIFISSLLIFIKPFFTKGYLLFADSVPFILNLSSFNHIANYVYSEKYLGLVENPVYILNSFFINKMFLLLNKFFCQETLTVLSVFIPFLALNFAIYFSFMILFKNKFHSFLFSLLYIFSMVTFDMLFTGGIIAWSNIGGFFFFASFITFLKTGHNKYLIFLLFSSLLGVMNVAFFYCIILACFIYFLIYLILNLTKKNLFYITSIIKKLFIIAIFVVSINAFWILPSLLIKSDLPDTYKTDNSLLISRSKIATTLNNFQFGNVFRKELVFSKPFQGYNNKLYVFAFFSFLIISLSIIINKLKKNKDITILFVLFLIIFSFSLGVNFIFWNLFSNMPGWFLLRNPLRFIYLLFFIFSILLGLTLESTRNKRLYIFLYTYLIFNIFVFFKNDIWGFYQKSSLPKDYFQVQNYLSKKESVNKTVLFLPEFPWYPRYSWMNKRFYLPVITENLLDNPIIFSFLGRGRVPVYFNKFYDQKISPTEYASYLGKSGVKFILLHKDSFDVSSNNKNNINNINKIKGLEKVIYGKNLELFKIDDRYYYPTVYSNNQLFFKKINPTKYSIKINVNKQTKLIFNQPYNQNWHLYLRKNHSSYDCTLDYQTVNTKECKNENIFFEGEELKYIYEKSLFNDSHQVFNSYGNQWTIDINQIKEKIDKKYYTINSDGSINIELYLYYEPQSYFYLGIIITTIIIFGSIIYLAIKS